MAAWFTTYLGDNGVKEGTASALLSAFWLAFVATRLTVAFNVLQLPPESEAAVILVASLAGTAILAGVVLGRGAGSPACSSLQRASCSGRFSPR